MAKAEGGWRMAEGADDVAPPAGRAIEKKKCRGNRREQRRRYRLKHPDKIRASARRRRARLKQQAPEKLRELHRRTYLRHRETMLAQAKAWRSAHLEHCKEMIRRSSRTRANKLTDSYVRAEITKRCGFKKEFITPALIAAHRERIKVWRLLKEMSNENR